jgi:hypothetical protein
MLIVEYEFDASNLDLGENEVEPVIMWWTSVKQEWFSMVPVEFKSKHKSIRHRVEIPIDDNASVEFDDTIRAECLVKTKNVEGSLSYIKAGSVYLHLSDIKGVYQSRLKPIFSRHMELRTVGFRDGSFFSKGEITISIMNSKVNWNIKTKNRYSLVDGNREVLDSFLAGYYDKSMAPFTHSIQNVANIDEQLNVHAPIVATEAWPEPMFAYWMDRNPDIKTAESFVSNLFNICLERKNMTKQQFIDAVKKQHESQSKSISEEYINATIVVANMCTAISNALPYTSDMTWRKDGEKYKQVIIESMHDAIRMLTGDCEGIFYYSLITLQIWEMLFIE